MKRQTIQISVYPQGVYFVSASGWRKWVFDKLFLLKVNNFMPQRGKKLLEETKKRRFKK